MHDNLASEIITKYTVISVPRLKIIIFLLEGFLYQITQSSDEEIGTSVLVITSECLVYYKCAHSPVTVHPSNAGSLQF